jgi:hypothetical protein
VVRLGPVAILSIVSGCSYPEFGFGGERCTL